MNEGKVREILKCNFGMFHLEGEGSQTIIKIQISQAGP
jgi:hypothetical protein